MVKLNERLKMLGFIPASSMRYTPNERQENIEDVLGGQRLSNQHGDVIVIEKKFPYGTDYGNLSIQKQNKNEEIFKFSASKWPFAISGSRVYIDTETTGLSGGTGTIPFLIGYGFFSEEGFTTKQIFLDDPSDEVAQLVEFSKELNDFDVAVTYNGKSFDIPLLKTRYLLTRLPNPFESFEHIDLLHLSRKIWKKRLTDRSLKEIETNILGLIRTQDDIPGWLIPQVYFDYLKSGDSSQLRNIIYHNQIDIVSMAVLYQKIETLLMSMKDDEAIDPLDLLSIANMYYKINEFDQAIDLYDKCLTFYDYSIEHKLEINMNLAEIYKKQNRITKALPHWTTCAELENITACIELAKYFEHQEKNDQLANYWADKAYNSVNLSLLPKYVKVRELKSIQKRLTRLTRRITNV